ncbi:1611_t:CDS:2, partial [Dentiscutata erythropus]
MNYLIKTKSILKTLFLSTVFLLPKSLIGILLAVSPFVELVSSPCWSILADRRNTHRKIIISCTTCIIFVYSFLPFTGKLLGFGGLFINLVIYSLFNGGVSPLIDNLTINVLNHKGELAKFGRQRLFGTISCGVSVVVLGFIIDRLNSLYTMFFSFGFFMGLFLLVLCLTPVGDFKADHHEEQVTDDIEFGRTSNEIPTQIVDTNVIVTAPPPLIKADHHEKQVTDDIDLVQFGRTSNEIPTQIVDTNVIVIAPPPLIKADHHEEQVTNDIDLVQFGRTSNETPTQIVDTNVIVTAPPPFMKAIFRLIIEPQDLKADAKLLGLSTFVGVTVEMLAFYFGKYIMEYTFPEVIVVAGEIISTLRVVLYAFFGKRLEFALVKPASLEIMSQLSPPTLRATAIGILAATESLST